jgi:hypothetical protein
METTKPHLPTDQRIYLFCAATAAWTALFLLVNYTVKAKGVKKRELDDIKNRIISIHHGLFSLLASAYVTFSEWPEYGSENSINGEMLLLVSCGYFLYDSVACWYYGLVDKGLVIHHGMVLLGQLSCLYYNFGAIEGITGLMYAEVTNFPMHARMILKSLQLRYSKAYEVFEVLYMLLYIVARGIFCPIMCWGALPKGSPLFVKVSMSGLVVQSQFFIFDMLKILRKRYQQYIERCEKKVNLAWFKEVPDVKELSYFQKESKQKIF